MEAKPKILVTGANGQVGKELREWAARNHQYQFSFLSREDLPIHHFELVRNYFNGIRPDYCINCAAFTAVDRAESEKELAFLVNAEAVGVLAAVCKSFGTKIIHISTDYVFNGNATEPYKEDDPTNPVNTYGASKLKGEALCLYYNPDSIIIRTAWVYSEFGQNFVKTMLRLMHERDNLNVVNDQVGAPTYAADLANAIMQIIQFKTWVPGIYHYSNLGRISWFDFAVAIRNLTESKCEIYPVPTSEFPTAAKRPSWSLLNTEKIRNTFHIETPGWEDGLHRCLKRLGYGGLD